MTGDLSIYEIAESLTVCIACRFAGSGEVRDPSDFFIELFLGLSSQLKEKELIAFSSKDDTGKIREGNAKLINNGSRKLNSKLFRSYLSVDSITLFYRNK